MKKLNLVQLALLIILLSVTNLYSQGRINFVNYGPKSEIKEGDDDFIQVIFLKIPETESDQFTIRLFDMDCGNEIDLAFGEVVFDSKFKFSIYGGPGSVTAETITSHHPLRSDLYLGNLLKSLDVGIDEQYDNKWIDFIGRIISTWKNSSSKEKKNCSNIQ